MNNLGSKNLCNVKETKLVGYYYRIEFSVFTKYTYFIKAPGCVNHGRVTYVDRRIV
jgi:hypothetical protein